MMSHWHVLPACVGTASGQMPGMNSMQGMGGMLGGMLGSSCSGESSGGGLAGMPAGFPGLADTNSETGCLAAGDCVWGQQWGLGTCVNEGWGDPDPDPDASCAELLVGVGAFLTCADFAPGQGQAGRCDKACGYGATCASAAARYGCMDMPGACPIDILDNGPNKDWLDEDWGLCDPCWDGVSMDSYSGWGSLSARHMAGLR